MIIGKAAWPVGGEGADQPELTYVFGIGWPAELRRQLAEGEDAAQPIGHAGGAQLLEQRHLAFRLGRGEVVASLGDAMEDHGGERALAKDPCVGFDVLELEMRPKARTTLPNETAHAHHGMQRVHADESPRHRHAGLVQATRETVDEVVERQAAQAGIGQPGGDGGELQSAAMP